MKKWATALMIVTLVFSLMACGGESTENEEEVSANATISENSEVEEPEAEEAEATTEETAETEETESLSADSVSENGETVSADSITEDSTDLDREDSVAAESTVATNENETNNTENNSGNGDGATSNADAAPGNASDSAGNADAATGNVNNSANAESTTNDGASDSAESSVNTTGPVPLGYGDDLTYSGSITLPSGLTIRTLNQFNYAGMNTDFSNSWMGDVYSDIVAQNYGTMIDNFDAFNGVYTNSAINVTSYERIEWRSDLSNATGAIELRKCDDHYKIIIRGPYLDLATAQSLGWTGLDSYKVAMSQEALTVLLSTISSTPTTLQESIIASLYTAPDGQEPIDVNGAWTRIGDCQIRVSAYDFTNGNHIIVFRIAP